ncbi:hypothetical protein RvY_18748-2 [Ramazzottius varieornatus]|uniref:long-chain-fatty-acid--CoA ligase n=1 Tax=Ramazzottius varieornatus TaxID=947166 RepID=A0A1D1W6X6_RAMVA|nr:hypothetical protein RvY_18748-2 [Ramazzottius varieornatus]
MAKLTANEVFISYLPLSHVAAQMTDLYLPITTGGVVYFAPPEALKGQGLIETWVEAKPTALIGVPRVWDKIQEKLEQVMEQKRGLKQKLCEWAMNLGLRANLAKAMGIEEKCKVSVTTLAQARYLDVLKKEIQRGIDKANLKAQSNAQVVRKFLILPVDFSVPGGELGPTLKLKRPSVVEKYADEIEELYDGH